MNPLDQLGAFERRGDRLDLRFERYYPRSIDRVWSALTDPARLQDWMGAAYVEPHVGGRYELMLDGPNPMSGRIVAWEPPEILEFTWGNAHSADSVARYELSRQGDGTRLIFMHKGVPHANCALLLPGWHLLFERLGGLIIDAAVRESKQSWRELQAIYVDRYKFTGVTLDP